MAALPNAQAPVISDTVTLYNPALTWIETRVRDGKGWRPVEKRLDGQLLMPGSVTANAMNVQTLSALSATLGTFRSATAGERVEISDNRLSVYDAAGCASASATSPHPLLPRPCTPMAAPLPRPFPITDCPSKPKRNF